MQNPKGGKGKKFLIVYAHPEPKSYTASAKEVIVKNLQAAGHEVKVNDLYAMKWNPVIGPNDFKERLDKEYLKIPIEHKNAVEKDALDPVVKEEVEKIKWCDYLIIVAPYWWGSVPAMVKGWIDRCLVCGVAWDFGKYWNTGPLKGKKAWFVTSVFGPDQMYTKEGAHGMTFDNRIHHLTWGTLAFCGFDVLPTFVAYNTSTGTDEDRKNNLNKLEALVKDIENIKPLYTFS